VQWQFGFGTRLGGADAVLVHEYAHTRMSVQAGLLTPWVEDSAASAKAQLSQLDEAAFRRYVRSAVVGGGALGRAVDAVGAGLTARQPAAGERCILTE
jgi:hypothetical protein